MRTQSVPRQLLFLMGSFAGVTLLVAGVLGSLLWDTLRVSSGISRDISTTLARAYQLTERLGQQQAQVQVLLRQKDPDEMERLVKDIEKSRGEAAGLIAACGTAGAPIQSRFDAYVQAQSNIVTIFLQGDVAIAYEKLLGTANPLAETLNHEVRTYYETADKDVQARTGAQQAATVRHAVLGSGASAVVLLCVVALGWRLRRRLTRHLAQLTATLSDGAEQATQASSQVSAASQSLAEGASEQAASLEETSSSLEEMASMTRRNAESAQQATTLARQARTAADQGATDMTAMSAAMQEIQLGSDGIAKIIRTIDEIAFQTNILALNAAVEAARAGEAGMGFAVVADEVRNLAQRSAQAAKETAAKIETAIAKTSQGVQISQKVGTALNDIVDKIRQLDTLVAEVAAASAEQSQGIGQLNTAVSQVDKVTQSNAANAEESASAAEELRAQAGTLREAVKALQQLVGGQTPPASDPTPPAKTAPRPDNGATPADVVAPKSPHQRTLVAAAVPEHPTAIRSGTRPSQHAEGQFTDF